MAKRKAKHSQFNKVPKFCTGDSKGGSCVIYELKAEDRQMTNIEALFTAVRIVRYDGNDAVIEVPEGADSTSFFLQLRTGSFLPETIGNVELTWFEADDGGMELSLDEIIVMCSI